VAKLHFSSSAFIIMLLQTWIDYILLFYQIMWIRHSCATIDLVHLLDKFTNHQLGHNTIHKQFWWKTNSNKSL